MQFSVRGQRFSFNTTSASLVLTALLWSSNFVVGRAIHNQISPVTLNFLRWAIALGALLPFTLSDLRVHRAILLRRWKLIALLGLTGIAAFQTLVYVALTMTTALNTVLLLSLGPLAIVLTSWIAFGERITRAQGLGLLTSLAGAGVLILHGEPETLVSLRFNAGDLCMLLAVAIWAIYSVLLKRRPAELPPLALHTSAVAAGALWMLPAFGWQAAHGRVIPHNLAVWAAVGFIGLFSTAIAHALWARGVATIGANRAGVFLHLMPLFGTALAVAFLGEQFGLHHAAGAALVLSGVALASRK